MQVCVLSLFICIKWSRRAVYHIDQRGSFEHWEGKKKSLIWQAGCITGGIAKGGAETNSQMNHIYAEGEGRVCGSFPEVVWSTAFSWMPFPTCGTLPSGVWSVQQGTKWRFGHYLGDFINVIIGIILTKSTYLEPQYSKLIILGSS